MIGEIIIKLSFEKKIIKITNHVYQPKHEVLRKDLAEEILKKYNAKPGHYLTL